MKTPKEKNPNILVIEDNDALRDSLIMLLQGHGYRVAAASNGEMALTLLRRGLAPCLILLDLMMPVKTGWAFRDEQMKDPRLARIPTVLLSSVDGRQLPGIVASLPKPVDPDKLFEIVEANC